MQSKRFKPLLDKAFWIILIPTLILLAVATVISCYAPIALLIIIPVDVLSIYFLFTPLFGYVELREITVYVKLGLIMEREVPYERIRSVEKARKLYSDSMVSLKCALEHVNIRYNRFDVLSVSVQGNDDLINEINARISKISSKEN
jgi:hypothetical protein